MQRPCQAPRPLPPLRTPPPAPVLTWNRPNAATESARWRGRIAKLLTDGHLQACSQTKAGLPRFQTAAAQTTPTCRQTSVGFGKGPQEFPPRRPDLRPRRPDLRPCRPDLRPRKPDLRPRRPDLRSRRPDLRPRRPDLRPRRPDLRRCRPDLRRCRPVFRWRKLEFGWQQGWKKRQQVRETSPDTPIPAWPGRERGRWVVARLRFWFSPNAAATTPPANPLTTPEKSGQDQL